MNTPLVSVIIPAYNAERYLADAITSVLKQSVGSPEIIVVDDGSTDHTAQVAKYFGSKVRFQTQPNAGAGAARNTGVRLAQGQFIGFHDADDLWEKDKLERQLSHFDQNADLDMIFGHVEQFISPELIDMLNAQTPALTEAIPGLYAGSMLIKREQFFRVGLFREDLKIGEFIDWYARAQDLDLNMLVLPQVVIKRRIHQTNQMRTKKEHHQTYVRVLKAALDRRRQGGLKIPGRILPQTLKAN